jgi:dihydroorotate dehydrogenase
VYRWLIKPLLFQLPAETAHQVAFWLLCAVHRLPFVRALLRTLFVPNDQALRVKALGLVFPSPVVLAAGFDKSATGFQALLDIGFGAVEVGTITARAQAGNPKPRLFRLPQDRALLNRMGFNNAGSERVRQRLARARRGIVGVNVGKTKAVADADAVADYVENVERLRPFASYVVVNVSSPNTPGLRDLQAIGRLRPLLVAVKSALLRGEGAPPPLLVKIAPDLADPEIEAIADLCVELGVEGVVATNTTVRRQGLSTAPLVLERLGSGGISGAPLRSRALEVLRLLRARAGSRLVLVAAGGIESADDAWDRLVAGASLVQIYTSLIYEGPGLPRRLGEGLLERARGEGFESLEQALRHYHSQGAGPRGGSVGSGGMVTRSVADQSIN